MATTVGKRETAAASSSSSTFSVVIFFAARESAAVTAAVSGPSIPSTATFSTATKDESRNQNQ